MVSALRNLERLDHMQIEELPRGDSIRSTETHGDFLWGCEAISKAIGRNKRVTFWLLENGELKSPRKIRGRWMVARAALLRELGAVS
ncbi:MAG: hypothetical protein WA728_17915 [Xanthobacteraceae bacterium]